ncbi:hypothetical protein TRICI_001805 [Trichomonascus ciferrii]|uniref:Uncharacterized protein n=1 Tax=Trichomonascus ciferrii TaxID=44093 RepID=A0A642V7C5_9ASCO|nr:hypothetical protein TRICI_001805 [Trichomonascus ciferrii]
MTSWVRLKTAVEDSREITDTDMSDRTVPVQSGESGGLEEPFNENYLCLRFREKGWKSKIEAAMSVSKPGDFVVEFIECKGKFMDYVHWYYQRFLHEGHRLTADYTRGICIAITPNNKKHQRGIRMYEYGVSSNLEAVGPRISHLCSSLGSADVKLPQYTIQPDGSYEPRMSDILNIAHGREMTISSAMGYAVSQPHGILDGIAERLFCGSQFQVESVVLMRRYERSLRAYSYDFSPERILAMVPQVEERWRQSVLRCGCESAFRKIENLEWTLETVSQTPEGIQNAVSEVGGKKGDNLLNAIKVIRPYGEAIQSYIRHLSGLLPNVQVDPPTEQDYTDCYNAMKSGQDHAVEYIVVEPVPEEGIFIRTSSLLGFYNPEDQQIPEHIQLTGNQLKEIFLGRSEVVNDELAHIEI